MSGEFVFAVIVAVLATSTVVLAVIAARHGRQVPLRNGPWITGLVFAAVPAVLITIVAIAAALHGGAWMIMGAIGLWGLVFLTVVNPRWAAYAFVGSGVVLPIMLAIGSLLVPADQPIIVEPTTALGFYTLRAIITAGLLLWATQRMHHPTSASNAAVRLS